MHWQLPESLRNELPIECEDESFKNIPKRRVLLVLEVSASLEEGPVLRTVPVGRVNTPVHIPCDCGYSRTKIRFDKDRRHLETP